MKLLQLRTLIKKHFFLKQISYDLSLYKRIHAKELALDINEMSLKLITLQKKLIKEKKNPENEVSYVDAFTEYKRVGNIKSVILRDEASIVATKKAIKIIKEDLKTL